MTEPRHLARRATPAVLAALASAVVLGSSLIASPARAATCPATTTLTPGSQSTAATAATYCGGTYSDTWDAADQADYVAFYTTAPDQTVAMHYEATSGQIEAEYDEPDGSGGTTMVSNSDTGPSNTTTPRAYSYTYHKAGEHYIYLHSGDDQSMGEGYTLTLTGAYSATPASGAAPSAPAPACPASSMLTPGGPQDADTYAVLYCGGTYSDAWDADGESDWIAIYTTTANATVNTTFTATSGSVSLDFDNPTSDPDGLPMYLDSAPCSNGSTAAQTGSVTFDTTGKHYIHVSPCAMDSLGVAYTISLSGAYSQTPPATAPPTTPTGPTTPKAAAPTIALTAHPKTKVTTTGKAVKVTFRFTGGGAVTGFGCRIDGGASKVCTSPVSYTLSVGKHTFQVASVGPGGASAVASFTVSVKHIAPKSRHRHKR